MNNPFAQPPRSQLQDTAQRFPDILAEDPDLRQPQQQGFYPQQQQQQPQYQQQQYTGFQQPQQTGYGQQGGGAYLQPQGTGFGGGGGYGGGGLSPGGYQQQQQQPQQQFYQPQPSPSSYADLDPYSSLSAFASQPSPSPSGQQSQQQGGGTLLAVQQTQSHPRQFVQENKAALTAWDDYAWKQLLGRVDALREAWEQRQAGIKAAANQGADPTLVDQLQRQAGDHVDGCHAAKMQLSEVKSGWRHSTDPASKARVREALNAGITSLPEYPSALQPSQLGGAFHRSHEDASRKHNVMSQFQPQYQQAQYTGFQQPQQTGFQQPQQTGFSGGYGGGQMQPQMTGYMPQQQTGYQQPQQGYGGQQQPGGYGQGGYY